jgi:hypothetical protein
MELKRLAEEAIDYLKSRWGLPDRGLLAGGALANTIWSLKNGTDPVINDIDIFVYVGHLESINDRDRSDSLFRYVEKDIQYVDDYAGVREHPVDKRFYVIKESTNEGMLNTITYDASDTDPMLILDSFDLSCTAVGFDLSSGNFYWTNDFENFLETGKIRVSNVCTPSHTAIRLVKKGVELGVGFDEHELKILMYCIEHNMSDTLKRYFKQKRMDDYTKVESLISKYLVPYRCEEVEKMIKLNYNIDDKLYGLMCSQEIRPDTNVDDIFDVLVSPNPIFEDDNLKRILTGKDFLNYMRTVYGNKKRMDIFSNIYPFFNGRNYFDVNPNEKDMEILKRLVNVSPFCVEALKGMTLSEQINVVNRTFAAFDDKTVALALMENGKIVEPHMDESDLLLLELSMRKEIFGRIEARSNLLLELLENNLI